LTYRRITADEFLDKLRGDDKVVSTVEMNKELVIYEWTEYLDEPETGFTQTLLGPDPGTTDYVVYMEFLKDIGKINIDLKLLVRSIVIAQLE
jgi:hypothetical protein